MPRSIRSAVIPCQRYACARSPGAEPIAQQRVGQRRGDEGLADAAGSGEQVGMGRPSLQLGQQAPRSLAMCAQTV